MTNFVLCIHVQIRFASTEKNYSHRLACILFFTIIVIPTSFPHPINTSHPTPSPPVTSQYLHYPLRSNTKCYFSVLSVVLLCYFIKIHIDIMINNLFNIFGGEMKAILASSHVYCKNYNYIQFILQ